MTAAHSVSHVIRPLTVCIEHCGDVYITVKQFNSQKMFKKSSRVLNILKMFLTKVVSLTLLTQIFGKVFLNAVSTVQTESSEPTILL